jgi:benzoyl-CoA reductase/2-hydroxyglutaryl-CoA dehydratase subunit BcrC/BadD/HgdB
VRRFTGALDKPVENLVRTDHPTEPKAVLKHTHSKRWRDCAGTGEFHQLGIQRSVSGPSHGGSFSSPPAGRVVCSSPDIRRMSSSVSTGGAGAAGAAPPGGPSPLAWFGEMIDHCCDYAEAAKARGQPIVGIMCEFTPREIILAAGAVPVCLCGGSAATIPAAEEELPVNLCPLIKSTYGYLATGTNPFLKWADLVVAETTCDGKKKMFELMARSKPMYVLELPQKADDPEALEHWTREVRKFKEHLEERFGRRITSAKLREAIRLMNRERSLRRRLAGLMTANPPPLTGRQLLGYKSTISGIEADLEKLEEAIRVHGAEGGSAGPAEAGTTNQRRGVRVLLTGVPVVHGAERVVDLIEESGAVVVCMENCTGLKPILEDVDEQAPDPLAAIARKYYHLPCSVMTPNGARLESLRALAAQYRPQCVIELVWQACLTYDVESLLVRQFVEHQLGLPYLKLVTDYSPSDSARLRTRIEALLETTRSRRGP